MSDSEPCNVNVSETDVSKVDVSIVIPVLNEADQVVTSLSKALRVTQGLNAEIIVVDGGSTDNTVPLITAQPVTLIHSTRGRARQMNAGASVARGRYLVFLHIDTGLPDNFAAVAKRWLLDTPKWGFFRLRLTNRRGLLRLVEAGINLRSRVTRGATGDQTFFCHRELFREAGCFPDIALMEDVVLSRTLKKLAAPKIEPAVVTTSSRRWEKRGICRTVLEMWFFRLAFLSGVSPDALARRYYPAQQALSEQAIAHHPDREV